MTNIVERARNRNFPYGHLELIDKLANEVEQLQAALTKIRSVVGTSTEAWLIANRALEHKP